MNRNYFLISLVIYYCCNGLVLANPVPGTPGWDSGFDGERAKSHVFVLASDSLGGRYSGFIGTDKADKYITDHFRNLGLAEPFGNDGYFHNFTYGAGEYKMPSSLVVEYQDGTVDSAFMWEDFNIYKYSGFGNVIGKVVFAGYGVSAPEKGWDEYADIDVMGKIVLVTRGLPAIDTIDWNKEGSSGFKSNIAYDKGAIGFLMTLGDPPKYATIQDEYFLEELPAMWISETLADNILGESGKTIQDLRKETNNNHHSVSLELNAIVTMQVSGEYYPERQTRNICGILPGSDPELRKEVVIIGAHMDHHGIDAAGNIYPGADDNASGAAAMMELATVFSSNENRAKRSIMFMGFAAEEEGLVGSRKFVESLPMDGYDVVAMLNMDMVGVGSGEIGIGGLDQFPPLEGMFTGEGNGAWQDSSLDEIAFWSLHGSSDHAAFMDVGIPSYVIGARGSHPNYHTPNDTVGAIQPEVLKAVGDMMYHCALCLADNVPNLRDYSHITEQLSRKYPIAIAYTQGSLFKNKFRQ